MSVSEQIILVGSRSNVGKVTVDPAAIRSEGGIRPELIVPITVLMNPRAADGQLAVTWLRGRLRTSFHVAPGSEVCAPVDYSLLANMPARSLPSSAANEHRVDLRFALGPAETAALESLRHVGGTSSGLDLYLSLEVNVAGLATAGEVPAPQTTPQAPTSLWGTEFGLHSWLAYFWSVSIQPLTLAISRETWIENVLPNLGYNHVRLIELRLPPPLPDHASAAHEFDAARRALDERRYGDCVAACRGLLSIWEKTLGATKRQVLADVLAQRLGWAQEDPRRRFIDDLWKSANDLANVVHHPEGQPEVEQQIDARDARLLFQILVGLSQYLATIEAK